MLDETVDSVIFRKKGYPHLIRGDPSTLQQDLVNFVKEGLPLFNQ